MGERRYSDEEIRRIFGLAASGRPAAPPARPGSEGFTLADIQSIGLEAGLDPDMVARAAASLDARPPRAGRSWLGMPIEVSRTVALPRAPTDHEWDRLVGELRTTFRARGRVMVQGNLREWSNGNLHACVEPTDTGWRLRMGTLKGDVAGYNFVGGTGIAGGVILGGIALLGGGFPEAAWLPATFGVGGIGVLIANVLRLPRWAGERERQMARIAERITAILSKDDEPRS